MKEISSTTNPEIKFLHKIQQSESARKKSGVIIVEGIREISIALKADYKLKSIYVCKEILPESKDINAMALDVDKVVNVSKQAYNKIAYRENNEGAIALFEEKNIDINSIKFKRKEPLILILDGIEKPGNIGAVLRTADATGVDLVCCCNTKSDIFNPNVIRSSLGGVFSQNVIKIENDTLFNFLKTNNINIVSTYLFTEIESYKQNYTKATALVMGSEAKGISNFWKDKADFLVKIPMLGKVDSMNISVSTAMMLYEINRQRNFVL